ATRVNLGTDFIILNRGQMTSCNMKLFPNCHATPAGGTLVLDGFNGHQVPLRGISLVESSFEPSGSEVETTTWSLSYRPSQKQCA
ncbi:hypothetical protein AVEN_206866-1, partial [Araneus ventricosus]